MPFRRTGRPGLVGVATRAAASLSSHARRDDDMVACLQRLAELRDAGRLSEAEFGAARAKLLR